MHMPPKPSSKSYVVGWTTDDPELLDQQLRKASEDVDGVLGDYAIEEDGVYVGLKLDPTELDYVERNALMRATCAQAEYRISMGRLLTRPAYLSTSGPEFSTTGRPPIVGPKAMRELSGSGLLRNVIALGARRRVPSWYGFSHNVDD